MEKKGASIWNVPNALTLIRLLLIPVYWLLFTRGLHMAALAVFIAASLTDLMDGHIARKYQLITSLGKLMDPVADKAMVLSVMLSLALDDMVPWLPLLILLCKEALMVIGGAVMLAKGVVVSAQKVGKLAQAAMVASLILSFFSAQFDALGAPVHLIVLWISVGLALCALVYYFKNALNLLRQQKKAP